MLEKDCRHINADLFINGVSAMRWCDIHGKMFSFSRNAEDFKEYCKYLFFEFAKRDDMMRRCNHLEVNDLDTPSYIIPFIVLHFIIIHASHISYNHIIVCYWFSILWYCIMIIIIHVPTTLAYHTYASMPHIDQPWCE